MMNRIRENKFQFLAILTLILVVANTYAIYAYDLEVSRLVRIISSVSIFTFFLFFKGYLNRIVLFVFALFVLKDLFVLDYEVVTNKTFAFYASILAYSTLAFLGVKKTDILKSTPSIVLFGVLLVGINIFNVYYLSDIIQAVLDNQIQYSLFFVQGAVLLLLGISAGLYYNKYTGKIPLYYLYFVVCFIFSDIFGLAAYFFDVGFAYYPERILYILALVVLTSFALEKNYQRIYGNTESEKKLLF